jgi:hypothetical protein
VINATTSITEQQQLDRRLISPYVEGQRMEPTNDAA